MRRVGPLFSYLCLGGMILHFRFWTADHGVVESVSGLRHGAPHPTPKKAKSTANDSHEPIHLVYASDDSSLPGVEASIRSVMCHASEPVTFHYIGDTPLKSLPEVKYYNLTQVSRKYRLQQFTNPHERAEDNVKGLNTNLANYARFAIDKLLPNESKAMWVDVDTLVRCDVVPMFRETLSESDKVIAAVPSSRNNGPKGFKKGLHEKLNMKKGFNAGVYVVDLDRWRSQKITSKIRMWAQRNRREKLYKLGSQGPITLAFHDNFESLDPKWNTKVSHVDNPEKRDDAENACLLHWSGPNKPWNEDGIHKDLWVACPKDEGRQS